MCGFCNFKSLGQMQIFEIAIFFQRYGRTYMFVKLRRRGRYKSVHVLWLLFNKSIGEKSEEMFLDIYKGYIWMASSYVSFFFFLVLWIHLFQECISFYSRKQVNSKDPRNPSYSVGLSPSFVVWCIWELYLKYFKSEYIYSFMHISKI